jgi:hypothetical protein
MLTLRCTQRLLARLRCDDEFVGEAAQATTRLGDWYATLLPRRRPELALCVSERTRIGVLVRVVPTASFIARFRVAVGDLLPAIGLTASEAADELREMDIVVPGRTANRSVVGTMLDLEQFVPEGRVENLLAESVALADVISLAMPTTPRLAALAAFR